MSKLVKELIQSEYESKMDGVSSFVVVSTKGMTGKDNNLMRGELSKKAVRMMVVKNSLMRRALDKLGAATAASLFMAGPCTIAFGGDSVVDVAKDMVDYSKKYKVIELKGALIEGEVMMGEEGVKTLSSMPSRAELQGTVVMLAMSPGRRISGAAMGPGGIIAGCIKALADKLEKEAA